MRLLKCGYSTTTEKLNIELCEFFPDAVQYAILSHRWGPASSEVSYREFADGPDRTKPGYKKIEECCKQALNDGLQYVWIDTCCIDKSSSAELTEAINAMYKWYERSSICYAYLKDIKGGIIRAISSLSTSDWFTRGWTLQELIAPKEVIFFNADWKKIGQKSLIAQDLNHITKIPIKVLLDPQEYLPDVCISQKFYWASRRRTSREEDRTYSLIGLFNISLPIIYGEGNRAFYRLQEKIMRVTVDHSIFAWHLTKPCSGLLADSPDAFAKSGDVRSMDPNFFNTLFETGSSPYQYTSKNVGLEIQLPLAETRRFRGVYVAHIACHTEKSEDPLYLILRAHQGGLPGQFFRTRLSSESLGSGIPHEVFKRKLPAIENNIWVVEPYKVWQRSIRPLPPDDLETKSDIDKRAAPLYVIHLRVPKTKSDDPKIIATYPMSNPLEGGNTKETEFITETNAGVVWVVSILLRKRVELKILMVIIESKLLWHMECDHNFQYSPLEVLDYLRSCEEFYEKCAESSGLPCTMISNPVLSEGGLAKPLESWKSEDISSGHLEMILEKLTIKAVPEVSYDPKDLFKTKCFKLCIEIDQGRKVENLNTVKEQEDSDIALAGKALRELLAKCEQFCISPSATYYVESPILIVSEH